MPYLKLKIVSDCEVGQNDTYSFTHLGGTIGRSEDCDWTLLDSDRFVSKKHLAISYRDQQFILTDLSSNGVVINNSTLPLGRGNEHRLQTTDSLVIGKHVLNVEDVNLNIEEANPFQTPSGDDDLLGLVLGTKAAVEPNHNPIQEPQSLFNVPESFNLSNDNKQESELGLESILSAPIKSPVENAFIQGEHQANPFDVSLPPVVPVSGIENGEALSSKDSLIPDDWDMFKAQSNEGQFESAEQPHSSAITDSHFEVQQESNPFVQSELQTGEQKLPTESISPFIDEEQPLEVVTSIQPKREAVPPLVESVVQQTSSNIQEIADEQEVSDTTPDDFFTVLYEKLGLSKEFKATINREDFAQDVATILLSTTQGLMSLLASRTAFKQESRLSSTLIQPRSNNPIKFSIDPVDTLEMLLVKKKKGYMSVGDSYDEAMEDIQLHQMAFMSGLQGTLDGVLAQLDPEDIEQEVSKNSQRFMGLNSNSQCWKIYKEKQPLLAKSVKENLNEVLGTHFSDAYQAQINSFKNDK